MKNSSFKLEPELEQDFHRIPYIGYEPEDANGFLRCINHGAPHPLIRWHQHEEYELHIITETSGRMFVGDYIGEFGPGNLVLTGPNLPHNWISYELPEGGIESRDFSLQFSDEPFRNSCRFIPELNQALPLLERAKSGIEFYGISDFALEKLQRIKASKGIHSFTEFLTLILKLSEHSNYKLLSNSQSQSQKLTDIGSITQFSDVISYIKENYQSDLSMSDLADRMNMNNSKFSKYFKREYGDTYTSFITFLRLNKACQLLLKTDKYISTICYEVGYHNVSNFNRRFSESMNVTPTEYRRLRRLKYN